MKLFLDKVERGAGKKEEILHLDTIWKKASEAYSKENYVTCLEFTNLCISLTRDSVTLLALENNQTICNVELEKSTTVNPFDRLCSQAQRELANINSGEVHNVSKLYTIARSYLVVSYNAVHFSLNKPNEGILQSLEDTLCKIIPTITSKILGQRYQQVDSDSQTLQQMIDKSFDDDEFLFSRPKKKQKLSQERTEQEQIDNILSIVKHYTKNLSRAVSKPTSAITSHMEEFKDLHVALGSFICLVTSCLLHSSHEKDAIRLLESNTMTTMFSSISRVCEEQSSEMKRVEAISEFLLATAIRTLDTDRSESEAFSHCQRCIELYPGEMNAALLLTGVLAYEAGNMKDAEKYLKKCVESRKCFEHQSLILLGCIYSNQKNYKQAMNYFQQSIRTQESSNTGSILPLYNIAIQYGKQKNYFAQYKTFEFVLKAMEDKPRERKSTGVMIPETTNTIPTPLQVMYMMGQCGMKQKNYEFANAAYQYILDFLINDTNNDKCWGTLHGVKPISIFQEFVFCLLESDDCEKALSICNHVLKSYPDDPIILLYKADALLSMEQASSSECIKSLEHAIQLFESIPVTKLNHQERTLLLQGYNNIAQVYICMDQKTDALLSLKKAYSLIDEQMDADMMLSVSFNMALLFLQMNEIDSAASIWFKQRHIEIDREADYYLILFNKAQRKEPIAPTPAHVTSSISEDQVYMLNLEVLHRYYRHLQGTKSQAPSVAAHLVFD